jgi:archaellum component FlaC
MTERDLLELIATQVGLLSKDMAGVKTDIAGVKTELAGVKTELAELKDNVASLTTRVESIEGSVTRIENEHGQKLNALFDGQKLNSQKLDRIESQVAKHEDLILRRVQ